MKLNTPLPQSLVKPIIDTLYPLLKDLGHDFSRKSVQRLPKYVRLRMLVW